MNLSGLRRYASRSLAGRREAAVLAPVIERDGAAHLLFTKRAARLGEHPGQMSFPGWSLEPEDADLQATALREAAREGAMAERADTMRNDPADAVRDTERRAADWSAALPRRREVRRRTRGRPRSERSERTCGTVEWDRSGGCRVVAVNQ